MNPKWVDINVSKSFNPMTIYIYIYAFFPGALSVSVTPATQSAVIGDNSVVMQFTVSGIPQALSWSWTFSPLGSGSQTTITQGTNNGDYTCLTLTQTHT